MLTSYRHTHFIPSYSLHTIIVSSNGNLSLRLPQRPSYCNRNLDCPRQPQRRRHPNTTPAQPPSNNTTHQQRHRRRHPTIPLHIVSCQHMRIAHQIAEQARQHRRRHLVNPQCPTRHNLSPTLECKESNGEELNEPHLRVIELLVSSRRGHDVSLHQRGGDED